MDKSTEAEASSAMQVTSNNLVASFDIGVKNLAVCVLERHDRGVHTIHHWQLIDLETKVLREASRAVVDKLDDIPLLLTVGSVALEAQTANNGPMKIISHSLATYFKCRAPQAGVSFVSPRNKLTVYDGPPVEVTASTNYQRNKKMAVIMCRQMLQTSGQQEHLALYESTKKKDDLADSFLQGVYFLELPYMLAAKKAAKKAERDAAKQAKHAAAQAQAQAQVQVQVPMEQ